jgi:hypothetical protein
LLVLAAIWGGSYLFIKLAVDDIEPTVTIFVPSLIAAALLVPYLVATLGRRAAVAQLRAAWRDCAVLGGHQRVDPFHARRVGRDARRLERRRDRAERTAVNVPATDP